MRIAIVDDEIEYIQHISSYIQRYCSGKGLPYEIRSYASGEDFLRSEKSHDLVFLDISMAGMDGLRVASKIREADEETPLVFVTQLAQYAMDGYKVNALDFLVKPVDYYSFELVFRKAWRLVNRNNVRGVVLQLKDGVQVLRQNEINYVEVLNHYLNYHTRSGVYTVKGTLDEAERRLDSGLFYRCHRCFLVNISRIAAISRDGIRIGEERIEVSRARREGLIRAVTNYMGGAL